MKIHPTAIVDAKAEIGRDVEIGPYSVVGPNAVLHDGCKLRHQATVEGYTTLGEGCEVFPQAVLGTPPQDVKYSGERTTLEIGYKFSERKVDSPYEGEIIAEEKDYTSNRVWVGVKSPL